MKLNMLKQLKVKIDGQQLQNTRVIGIMTMKLKQWQLKEKFQYHLLLIVQYLFLLIEFVMFLLKNTFQFHDHIQFIIQSHFTLKDHFHSTIDRHMNFHHHHIIHIGILITIIIHINYIIYKFLASNFYQEKKLFCISGIVEPK